MFIHEPFEPKYELDVVERDGKRFYILPNGEEVLSVTTIIGEKSDKTSLDKWKKRVGEEEAAKVSFRATARGTVVHGIIEKYLLNEDMNMKKQMPIDKSMVNSLIPHLDKINCIKGLEFPLFSYSLKTAGRTDCIANFGNMLSVIDFKTAAKKKAEKWIKNYFIQGTCYAMMAESLYSVEIPQVVILIGVEYGKPQVFIEDSHKWRNEVKEMFG